ncbi:MAG: porin family protein [Bacteroidota bacterium]
MKKIFFLTSVIIILGTSILSAQRRDEPIEYLPTFDERLIHFGYYVGLNSYEYKISYFDQSGHDPNLPDILTPDKDMFVEVDNTIGFNIGFIVDLRLHKNINLRFEPGLMSSSKTLTFIDPYTDPESGYEGLMDPERKVSSTFLHLPLLFKFSTDRYRNIRPYIIGGASYDYNFSSNEDNPDDNSSGEFRTTTHNFMAEVGIGMDFYFYFFKFSPSIRGVFALNNELVNDADPNSPWTAPIDQFKTRGVYLNLTFE